MRITKKTEDRFASALPRFQKVLANAKARDLNESDTVVIITDILTEVFGYEKYMEVTSELAIRGTFCDLAVKIGDKFQFLVECKAIGTELKDTHLRQAVGYGANKGIQWIILTNGADWQLYRIRFEQPISWDLVARFDLSTGNVKDEKFTEALYLIAKEGVDKCVRDELYEKIQCVNRFVIGSVLLSEPVIAAVRRELRRLAEGIRIEDSEIAAIIRDSVLRRDIVEGEEASNAASKVGRLNKEQTIKKTATKPKQDCSAPPSTTAAIADQPLQAAEGAAAPV